MEHLRSVWSPTAGLQPSIPSFIRQFKPFYPVKTLRNRDQLVYTACSASDFTAATVAPRSDDEEVELSGRERRKMRNERRESKLGNNWREEVEENLAKKVRKQYVPKSAELNMDNLSLLGPQWWIFRVSRVRGDETAQLVAKLLARNFPQLQFKVYAPSLHEKTRLKNGTYSTKSKPMFPGCAFLWCILNKEVHDFVRECEGVGGFVGAKIDYARKRKITKPRPVEAEAMEEIFRQAKEEQEKHDTAFQEEQQKTATPAIKEDLKSNVLTASKPIKLLTVSSSASVMAPGSSVRVASGNFSEFKGKIKKVNRRSKKATVSVNLFGKETLVDMSMDDLIIEP